MAQGHGAAGVVERAAGGARSSPAHNSVRDLGQRIDLQAKYGTRDLTDWLVHLLAPRLSDRLLDIGCGSGNHLLPLARHCGAVTGIDVSPDLLAAAKVAAREQGLRNVTLVQGSGDAFDIGRQRFDIVICNFAIYYMDAPEVIRRMASHLTREGVAYVGGSPDENAAELMQIHGEATSHVPETYAPGYSDVRKYAPTMLQHFSSCAFHRFVNPVRFPTTAVFSQYYEATALFKQSLPQEPQLLEKVVDASRRIHENTGEVCITKVVDVAELRGPLH